MRIVERSLWHRLPVWIGGIAAASILWGAALNPVPAWSAPKTTPQDAYSDSDTGTHAAQTGPDAGLDGKGLRFSYTYVPPQSTAMQDAYDFAVDTKLLERNAEITAMDGLFILPHPLHYVAAECGAVNAYYTPKKIGHRPVLRTGGFPGP